jgi:integrase
MVEHRRARKGEVKVSSHKGSLRLTWSYRKKRHELRPGLSDTPENRLFAEGKARAIELDMKSGNFDPTLEKYQEESSNFKTISAVELFRRFFEFKKSSLATATIPKYKAFLGHLQKQLGQKSAELDFKDVVKLKEWMESKFAIATAKDRLALLRAAWRFGIHRGWVTQNPWEELSFRNELKERPKPFTLDECKQIIEAFKLQFPHYAPMVEFRLSTGLRTGELAALEWRDVSEDCSKITICRAFNSSSGEKRPTKKNKIRSFKMPSNAVRLLQSLPRTGDLVFPAPEGGYIRADNFSKRQWRPILGSLGIDYRRPYTTRHTLASHSLNRGQNVVELAEILGNTPRTIYQNYAGQIGEAKPPDLF